MSRQMNKMSNPTRTTTKIGKNEAEDKTAPKCIFPDKKFWQDNVKEVVGLFGDTPPRTKLAMSGILALGYACGHAARLGSALALTASIVGIISIVMVVLLASEARAKEGDDLDHEEKREVTKTKSQAIEGRS